MESKYIVRVNILKFDNEGNTNSENFEYNFNEPTLIDARNKAIEKTKDLLSFFTYEMPEDSKFSSPLEAELKGFKNVNGFSIDLSFVPEEGYEYQIYGEEELTIDSLQQEAFYYRDANIDYPWLTEVEDMDGEMVEVLESDLDFFLNSLN